MTAQEQITPFHCRPRGRGRSSYEIMDVERIFDILDLKKGSTFLDLGCGPGDYSVRASKIIGSSGRVYGLDQNADALAALQEKIKTFGLINIIPLQHDIATPLPFAPHSVHTALVCTVLHHFQMRGKSAQLFQNLRQVLYPEGKLVIVELHKRETSFGPPLGVRIAPEDLESQAISHGLQRTDYADLGDTYALCFAQASS